MGQSIECAPTLQVVLHLDANLFELLPRRCGKTVDAHAAHRLLAGTTPANPIASGCIDGNHRYAHVCRLFYRAQVLERLVRKGLHLLVIDGCGVASSNRRQWEFRCGQWNRL